MAQLVPSAGPFCQLGAFPCLILCYLLYIALGGVVFTAVEKPVEKELRSEVEALRRSFLQENPCVRASRLSELLGKALSAHHSDVAVLQADADDRHYDFTSSLYFVIVTLTTMGKMQPMQKLRLQLVLSPRIMIIITIFKVTFKLLLYIHDDGEIFYFFLIFFFVFYIYSHFISEPCTFKIHCRHMMHFYRFKYPTVG